MSSTAPRKPPPPPPPPRAASARSAIALLLATAAAAAAAPLPPPANSFVEWTPASPTYDAAAFDLPTPPAPPPAAANQRYLLVTLPIGPSHSFVMRRVGWELAQRGASVMAIAPGLVADLMEKPPPADAAAAKRWTSLRVDGDPAAMAGLIQRLHTEKWRENHIFLAFGPMYEAMGQDCDALLGNKTAMAAIKNFAPTFIVGDIMYPCVAVLSEKLGLPRAEVGVGSLISFILAGWPLSGAPRGAPTANVPIVPPFTSVHHVLRNAIGMVVEWAIDLITVRPVVRALHARHNVDPSTPAARARNTLAIVNADPAWEHPRALPAGVVLAGSITAGPASAPLPKDVAAWMAAASSRGDRVIYAALGSIFTLPPGDAAELLAGLLSLPRVAVLAKFTPAELSDDAVAALPAASAKILRWAPQNDILASGDVDLFISHGGAGGVGEAVYHGVPLVVAPQGAEQLDNAVKTAAAGFAIPILHKKPRPDAVLDATQRALASLDVLTARARAAQARARVARPPGAVVAAAAIERAALLGLGARIPLTEEVGGWQGGGFVVGLAAVAVALAAVRRWGGRAAPPSRRRKTD